VLDILKFIFSSFWIWFGFTILFSTALEITVKGIICIMAVIKCKGDMTISESKIIEHPKSEDGE